MRVDWTAELPGGRSLCARTKRAAGWHGMPAWACRPPSPRASWPPPAHRTACHAKARRGGELRLARHAASLKRVCADEHKATASNIVCERCGTWAVGLKGTSLPVKSDRARQLMHTVGAWAVDGRGTVLCTACDGVGQVVTRVRPRSY